MQPGCLPSPHSRACQQGGDTDGIYYQVIAGMSADMSGARLQPRICEQLAQQRGPEAAGEASSASSSEADSEEVGPSKEHVGLGAKP